MRYKITDSEWEIIQFVLSDKPRGVPRVDDRRVLNGNFWVLRSGAPWRDLPDCYGPYTTCYKRFNRWRKAGIWDSVLAAVSDERNTDVQMLDTPISFDDFLKVDIRVGTIVSAEEFPEARKPAYILHIDFGDEVGVKKTSAQITKHYSREAIVGRQVAAIVNFPPRQIGTIMSEVLTFGFPDGDGEVVMIGIDKPVPNGGRLF